MKNNPIEISQTICDEFTDYILSTYQVDESDIQDQIRNEINATSLYHGPYLHITLPFVKGDSLRKLINKGVISKEFEKLNVNLDRPLYKHQVESIERIKQGHSVVVTTGTGSGKTESFLYPILNSILGELETGEKEPGVRAILLYPMNALVNDQVDRFRGILKDYPEITFGSYTGETPKLEKDVIYDFDRPKLENEMKSRERMREEPPDLLITNYSMLEYLLLRPDDASIMSEKAMKHLKFFVLDEAHTYSGTKGIETSVLLKRTLGMVKQKPQFILTSATLGDKDSSEKILKFAHNLTDAKFLTTDIIFATRKPLPEGKIKYTLPSSLYLEISNHLDSLEVVQQLTRPFLSSSSYESIEELLYDLLIQDKNTYRLFYSVRGTRQFNEIANELNDFKTQELVALIKLISLAEMNGTSIFDTKYHLFISAPNRAFITIDQHPKMRFGNYNFIDGYKAFEISRCKNCNHIYIVGKIVNDVLEPDDSVDVYENYEESLDRKLDFFTLDTNEEFNDMEEFVICSKCGRIQEVNNLNKKMCSCGEQYYRPIYKVKNDKSTMKNNLTTCVHCGTRNNYGIIRSFRINQDTSTAVLAQIFISAMGEVSISNTKNDLASNDLFSLQLQPIAKEKKSDIKQLLAFSDSRRQASFFSVKYTESHEKSLKRRLIWEILKNDGDMSVRTLASKLEKEIQTKDLFDLAYKTPQSVSWSAILMDILFTDGQFGSEGLGLYYFDYNYDHSLIQANKEIIQRNFSLNPEEFITLLDLTINRFRKDSAIDYTISDLTEQERKDAFQYNSKSNFYTQQKLENENEFEGNYLNSFLPVKKNVENTTTSYLKKVLNTSSEKTKKLTESLYAFLINILTRNQQVTQAVFDGKQCYQIKVDYFEAHPYTSTQWFQCDKCKKITRYNIHNLCPEKDCTGHLVPCNPDEQLKDNYYRKEFKSRKIEKIITTEHTAQLGKDKARKYQDDFKNKKINILSCSTTFEMGVDIGRLENVFLRNMPPLPSNYVQRAGRAGRSKDASALVVTFCGNKPHDFSYFSNPVKMIDGVVEAPIFDTTNEKIIVRHLLAAALSLYFRKKPHMFHDTETFIYEDKMQDFKNYLAHKPSELNSYIDQYILSNEDLKHLRNFKWVSLIDAPSSRVNLFLSDLQDKVKDYEEAEKKAQFDRNYAQAGYYQNRLKMLKNENVITLLSRYAVIPKYGFPVDVVQLDASNRLNKEYLLQRDLSIAISEYAPDSEVIVDGQKVVSRYIKQPAAGSLEKYYYALCPDCLTAIVSDTELDLEQTCPHCHKKFVSTKRSFLVPSLGFVTDRKQIRATTIRPIKTYTGKIRYLGGGVDESEEVSYKDLITLQYIRNDKLSVINESGFYYCPKCGYTKKHARSTAPTFKEKNPHETFDGYPCKNQILERTSLGHIYPTDVIRIRLNISAGEDELITLVFALLEGISQELQIERTDVNGLVIGNAARGRELVLFDQVPGGAGYVKSLTDISVLEKVLKTSLEIVSRDCCDEETTCNSCLRNYYNQSFYKQMKRRYAKEILTQLLEG